MRHQTARNAIDSNADAAMAAAGGIAGASGNGVTGFNTGAVVCAAGTPASVASTGNLTVKKSGKFLVIFEASGTAGSGYTGAAMAVGASVDGGGSATKLIGQASGVATDAAGGVTTGIVATGAALGHTVNFSGIVTAAGGSLTVPGGGVLATAQGKITALEI